MIAELRAFLDDEDDTTNEPDDTDKTGDQSGPAERSTDDSSVFPKAGVQLSYIVGEFYKECGGREALEGLTTKQVCEIFIKGITKERQSSYCDLLKEQGHKAYGKTAQVFLSHAHQSEFLTVVDALQWHLRDQPDTVS